MCAVVKRCRGVEVQRCNVQDHMQCRGAGAEVLEVHGECRGADNQMCGGAEVQEVL